MDYRFSCAKIWTPSSTDDIKSFFEKYGQQYGVFYFNFDNGSTEASMAFIRGRDNNGIYKRSRINSIRYYNVSSDTPCCYISDLIGDVVTPTLYIVSLSGASFEVYYNEILNETTNSWNIATYGNTTELSPGQIKEELVISLNMPFMPVFATQELANQYIASPNDKTIYSQALNYYDPSATIVDTEVKTFNSLSSIIPGYLNLGETDENYSSGLFIDNVLTPINTLINKLKQVELDSKIDKFKADIKELTREYTSYNIMELIKEVPANRGVVPFPVEGPFEPKLNYTPFSREELNSFIDYASTHYTDISERNPIYMQVNSIEGQNDNFYYYIEVVHNYNYGTVSGTGVSNIKLIDNNGNDKSLDYYFDNVDYNSNTLQITYNVNGYKHAYFRYYPNRTENKCDNWVNEHEGYSLNENHTDVIILNKFNKNVPFYCSHNVYIAYQNKNVLWLQAPEEIEGVIRDDSIAADPTFSGVVHIKPIITLFNRYEMSTINGWDGNKLKVGDGYLLAPQVGAGIKTNGLFTGVVMGVKQVKPNSTINQRIGLFGFHEGVQSFFLNSKDGSAIFGKSGTGQIIIDPKTDKGMLYSSNYWREYSDADGKPLNYNSNNRTGQGMLIDLTTPEIRFGNGNFVVDQYGNTSIAGGGGLAGWIITDTTIRSGVPVNQGRMVIDSGATCTGQDAEGNKTYTYGISRIYTGQHNSITDNLHEGFYLSKEGLSVCSTYTEGQTEYHGSLVLETDKNPVIYSGGKSSINSGNVGFYLGHDGLAIKSRYYDEVEDPQHQNPLNGELIIKTTGNPKIYSGNHSSVTATNKGFYLGEEGLSIISKYYDEVLDPNHEHPINGGIVMKTGENPVIYSGNHTSLTSTQPGFYLGQAGFSIYSKYYNETTDPNHEHPITGKFTIKTDADPEIYSQNHSSLNSTVAGFYLGEDGLSIGDSFRVSAAAGGSLEIGRVSGSRKWVISGDANNSYIGYNASAFSCTNLDDPAHFTIGGDAGSVYIGTEGVRLGQKTAVDNNGNLVTRHLIVMNTPTDYDTMCWIGNWQFTNENFSCVYYKQTENKWYRLWMSAYGSVKSEIWNTEPSPTGTPTEETWKIETNGEAFFTNLKVPTGKNMNVAGTLTVSGTATVSGSLTVSGTLTANNGGSIGGFTIASNRLGSTTVGMYTDGSMYCKTLSASSSITVSGGLSTTGASGNITCAGDLTVSKTITSTGNLSTNGTFYSKKAITCDAGATFDGALSVGSNPITCGNLTGSAITGTSYSLVSGSASISAAGAISGASLGVSGAIEASSVGNTLLGVLDARYAKTTDLANYLTQTTADARYAQHGTYSDSDTVTIGGMSDTVYINITI